MISLFNEGGPLYMGIISIIGAVMLVLSVFHARSAFMTGFRSHSFQRLAQIREVGLFALIFGVLSTTISLVSVFSAIEEVGDVPLPLLAGGLKYATYTLIYGLIIYLLSLLISIILKWKITTQNQ
ncbi:MotA/TolQ/ExbB proton channel family protein [Roseivirga sp.]|uniref:MotA/TolQ/ExbB proton channel family protein n=1 Tax=Roseivirga sp. TaxID=1964215 RepID=UPI003B8CF9C0